jgi:predicted lipid-binding transport protein (Tim44 family)
MRYFKVLFLLILALSLITTLAFARGGGGQSFPGVGGGGGGGSQFPLLFFLPMRGSTIIWIIVIIIIVSILKKKGIIGGSRKGSVYLEDQPSAAPAPVFDEALGLAAAKQKLLSQDPNFSEQVFLDKVQTAFFLVQKAWTQRNQDLARAVMSEALYRRHKMQTDELLQKGRTNVLENIVIGGTKIVKIISENDYDAITVRIRASMSDYMTDDKTGQMVDGQKEPRPFTEYWAFVRRYDKKTQKPAETKAYLCSNCGAPLEINESGKCSYCGTLSTAAAFDWVVDTITQESEWNG